MDVYQTFIHSKYILHRSTFHEISKMSLIFTTMLIFLIIIITTNFVTSTIKSMLKLRKNTIQEVKLHKNNLVTRHFTPFCDIGLYVKRSVGLSSWIISEYYYFYRLI